MDRPVIATQDFADFTQIIHGRFLATPDMMNIMIFVQGVQAKYFERIMQKFGLNLTEAMLLTFIQNGKTDYCMQDLSLRLAASKSAIFRAIRSLEEKKMIKREYFQGDFRRIMLRPAGVSKMINGYMLMEQKRMFGRVFLGFSAEERGRFWKMMLKISENLILTEEN